MSSNRIRYIPQDLFKDSLIVNTINLRDNGLKTFDTLTFIHLKRLVFLDLGENHLPWVILNISIIHLGLTNTVTCEEGES